LLFVQVLYLFVIFLVVRYHDNYRFVVLLGDISYGGGSHQPDGNSLTPLAADC
jgi:hypothetical protein